MQATVRLDTHFHVGDVDPRIFGGFVEHLGRCVYGGIYDPGSPHADADGWRLDVIERLRALRMPLVRYPGGNFVSTYDWTDGIGPVEQRPRRPDFAWKSLETNRVGVHEFDAWCRRMNTQPMLAVNLGTAGAREAGAFVEYCNLPAGTHWADRRVANGRAEPFGVKTWCLGNEMDGPWQAGHVPAHEYALRAEQAGKVMKGLDPTIELIVAGSSARELPTYMEWDRTVLEWCWPTVDYIAAHRYSGNWRGDTAWFLAEGIEVDRILDDYRGLIAYVRGLKRSPKQVYVAFDEWNVWYKDRGGDGKWQEAPHLCEEVYNLEDALVVAQYLMSFIRNADLVKIACLAQVVNVIAPLLTRRDALLVQGTYWPIAMIAAATAGRSLRCGVECDTYRAGDRGEVPTLDAAACHDPAAASVSLFLVNRDAYRSQSIDVRLADASFTHAARGQVIAGTDPKAANTWEDQAVVAPQPASLSVADGVLRVELPPMSFACVQGLVRAR